VVGNVWYRWVLKRSVVERLHADCALRASATLNVVAKPPCADYCVLTPRFPLTAGCHSHDASVAGRVNPITAKRMHRVLR
jgi:hypothetical protein